jgi:hypothetical protein
MSINYTLHARTDLTPVQTLEILFGYVPQAIAETNIFYVRGRVFLAHGRPTDIVNQQILHERYYIQPQVSVLFFPDGVSSVQTALDALGEALVHWQQHCTDSLFLVADMTTLVWQYHQEQTDINEAHPFWTPKRLSHYRNSISITPDN